MSGAVSEMQVARPNATFNLAVPNNDGTPPKARVSDIGSALGIASTLIEANKERWRKMAMIRGAVDGNPPFNPATLKAAGLKYYPNFNTLEMKAYVSSALVPYFDLLTASPSYVDLQLDMKDKTQQDEKSRIVCEEEDNLYRYSEWFDVRYQKMLFDFVTFGKGFLMWDDDHTIRFRHVPCHRVLFPDSEDVDQLDWQIFGVLQTISPNALFNKVRNAERAKSAGWNERAVLRAIQAAGPYDPSIYDDYVGLQNQLRDNDLYVTARQDMLFVMNLYVKEFDQRWTHMILPLDTYRGTDGDLPYVPDDNTPDGKKELDEIKESGFLFRKIGRFADVTNIICPFFFEVANGSINGTSGLGKDIYAPMQIKDRMWCSRVNNMFLRSSVVLQAKDATSREKLQITQLQNVTILPPNTNVQNGSIFGDLTAAEETNRGLDLLLQQNTGIYRPTFEKPQGNPEPATNFRIRAAQSTTLSNSAVNRFVKQNSRLFAEEHRRLTVSGDKEATYFRKCCKDRGVSEEELKKTRYVRMYQNIGSGSIFLRQESLMTLMSPNAGVFQHLPTDGQANLIQDVIGSVAGQQKVERYAPFKSREHFANRDAWEATEENDSMQTGGMVMGYPEQNDLVHLGVHAQAGQQAVKGLSMGGNPQQIAQFLDAVIHHSENYHIATLLKNGREREVKPFKQVFEQLNKVAQQIKSKLQEAAKQQQAKQAQMQQTVTDAQIKTAKVKGELSIKTMKARHDMALKQAKTAQSLEQQKQQMAIADAQAAASIVREKHKAFSSPSE